MKYPFLLFLLSSIFCFSKPRDVEKKASTTNHWEKVVLRNDVKFRNWDNINYGSSFLIKLDTGIIACTAREFAGRSGRREKTLRIKDFPNELISWKMYRLNSLTDYVSVKSLALENRIEKKILIGSLILPFLAFSVEIHSNTIESLEPDVNKIRNKDTLYVVGYGSENKINVVEGIVETWDNSNYLSDIEELRIRTTQFLGDCNYVGSPILNKSGKVIGVLNRAYALRMNKKGKIIHDQKNPPGSYWNFFVGGTMMRTILGKDYGSKKIVNDKRSL
jgi:hypothetical protein